MSSFEIFVDSAGTAAYHNGKQSDKRSIAIAKENGVDITDQTARQFLIEDFDEFDFIYVMDNSNYQDVLNLERN